MQIRFIGLGLVAACFATSVGCSEKVPVIQRTYIDVLMKPGGNPSGGCQVGSGPWLRIGETSDKLVDDGAAFEAGAVTAQCSVIPNGDAFQVNVTAALKNAGEKSGSITLSGSFRPEGKQTGISASFANTSYGTYSQTDCVVDYKTSFQGVAAGRVWGVITCPKASLESQGKVCEGSGEFKFENCTQTAAPQ